MLFVTVAPVFGQHDYKDKLVLRAGSSAALELPFVASPQPEVTWKYKGACRHVQVLQIN